MKLRQEMKVRIKAGGDWSIMQLGLLRNAVVGNGVRMMSSFSQIAIKRLVALAIHEYRKRAEDRD